MTDMGWSSASRLFRMHEREDEIDREPKGDDQAVDGIAHGALTTGCSPGVTDDQAEPYRLRS